MAKRTPPLPEQVAETLQWHLNRQGPEDRVLPFADAVAVVKSALRTTAVFAARWLTEACDDEGSPLLLLQLSHGSPVGVLKRNAGRFRDENEARYSHRNLDLMEAGLTDVDDARLYFLADGTLWDSTTSDRLTPGDAAMEPDQCVVLTKTFKRMLERAKVFKDARAVTRAADEIINGAAFEGQHGRAADYLRGLLHAAGAGHRSTEVNARMRRSADGEGYSVLSMSLWDGDIDRVAKVLESLGIEPITESGR